MEYPVHIHDLNVIDPYILADKASNKYYLYSNKFTVGTTPAEREGTGNTFYALVSEDLAHWSDPILVFEQNDFWASESYEAPEVHYYNGKYYLLATFSAPGRLRRVEALVADGPLGPFKPVGASLTPAAWSCSDGTLYIDRDGDPWLVFAHDWLQVYDGQIAAIRVTKELDGTIGDPMILFRGSDAPWGDDFMYCSYDGGGGAAKGPWMRRMNDGGLVCLWTNYTPYGYAIGYAKSESDEIWGPWKQYDKPMYCLDGAHASMFERLEDGMLMMPMWHAGRKDPNGVEPGPTTMLMEVEEYNGLIEIVSDFSGNWWSTIGGHAIAYRAREHVKDTPTYTKLQEYGGPFARRRIRWAMAPETKFWKGKITTKD